MIIWNGLPRKIVEICKGFIQRNSSNTNIVQNGTYEQNYKRLGVYHNELHKAFCLQDYFLRTVELCIYMNEYMRRHKSLLCRLGELTLLCIYKIKRNKGFSQVSRTYTIWKVELEMIQFSGDIYDSFVPQLLSPLCQLQNISFFPPNGKLHTFWW